MVVLHLRQLVYVVVRTARVAVLLLATLFAGCGSLAPVASAPPTFTQEPAATPPAPTTTSTPGVIRVRWMYLLDRVALVLQEDGHTGVMEAARLRAPNGTVLASESSHRATPGEPRACGHPDVVPPFVVTLRVGPDVADRLKAGDPRYVLEVEEDGVGWYPRELLDWTILASPPCFSE